MARCIEIFTAGDLVSPETVALVRRLLCLSCRIEVLDMRQPPVAARAAGLGIAELPAVLVDGRLVGGGAGPPMRSPSGDRSGA